MSETDYLPMWGKAGRFYIQGVIYLREDDGGDRHILTHCGIAVAVWYNSDNDTMMFYAVCGICKTKWNANRAEELWLTIATPNQE